MLKSYRIFIHFQERKLGAGYIKIVHSKKGFDHISCPDPVDPQKNHLYEPAKCYVGPM